MGNDLDILLASIDLEDLQEFVRYYCEKDNVFQAELEIYFNQANNLEYTKMSYSNLLQETISYHEGRGGYFDYEQVDRVTEGLQDNYTIIDELIEKGRIVDAMVLCSTFLKQVTPLIEDSDDSSGSIDQLIKDAVECLNQIVRSKYIDFVDIPKQSIEELKDFYQSELVKDIYFDYGDYGLDMLESYGEICRQTNDEDRFLDFIQSKLKTLKIKGDYVEDKLLQIEEEFLDALEAVCFEGKFRQGNLQSVSIRKIAAQNLIEQGNFKEAKILIESTIEDFSEIDYVKEIEWKRLLLEVAEQMQDIPLIQEICRDFALNYEPEDALYWDKWRKTYAREEWNIVIEKEIAQIKKSLNTQFEVKTKRYYQNKLFFIGPIYQAENRKEELFQLLSEAKSLYFTFSYWKYLSMYYSFEDLYPIFTSCFLEELKEASSRSAYSRVALEIRKWSDLYPLESDRIHGFIDSVNKLYPRRTAMHQELNRTML